MADEEKVTQPQGEETPSTEAAPASPKAGGQTSSQPGEAARAPAPAAPKEDKPAAQRPGTDAEARAQRPVQEAGGQTSARPGEAARAPAAPKEDKPAARRPGTDAEARAERPVQAAGAQDRRPRGRSTRTVPAGIAHITATFNNTMVAITDVSGGVVSWSSAGRAGFKGSRKSTAFAATLVGQDAARQAVSKGMREVEVRVQGAGSGRESAIRALQSSGLNISVIKDVTPMPHNGCRPSKRRRV